MHVASFMGLEEEFAEIWYLYLETIGFALPQFGLLYLSYRLSLSRSVFGFLGTGYAVLFLPKAVIAIVEASWLCGLCAIFDLVGILICVIFYKRWQEIKTEK